MKKRMLSLFLAVVLCLSLLPTAALADEPDSGTAGTAAIQLGTGGLQGPTAAVTGGGTDYTPNSYVYFGMNGETPIKWRVLNAGKTSDDNDGVFLLSEQLLDKNVPFRSDASSSAWDGSDAQTWCTDFTESAFSEAERGAIAATAKEEKAGRVFGGSGTGIYFQSYILTAADVFFLSGREAQTYLGSYHTSPQLIARDTDGSAAAWWLRSPYTEDPDHTYAGVSRADGTVNVELVTSKLAARPALNLDASAVLFVSPAQGSSDVGLEPVGTYSGNAWKLTLKDDAHKDFTAKTTAAENNGLTFSYQNAKTGKNEYLSALVTNDKGEVTHYGRVQSKAISEPDSIQSIALPADFNEKTDKIYVFNEQDNGDYKTNYASSLVELSLTPASSATTISSITAVGSGSGNWLNGANWDPADASNHMTETAAGSKIYEIIYTDIAAGQYEVKFVANDKWTDTWGADEGAELTGDAAYGGNGISFSVETDNSTAKLVLDLSKFDYESKIGATYSITITPPGGGTEEPSVAEVTSGGETTGYPTLAAAFAAAQYGDTVKLLKDVTEESAIALSADDVTFDLNGHTASDCTLTLQSGAGLTITDSSEKKTGSFGDVTKSGSGSLILSGAAVGKLTVKSETARIKLQAGSSFTGYELPDGMVLADLLENNLCVFDGESVVSALNQSGSANSGKFTVVQVPADITEGEKSGVIAHDNNGELPENMYPNVALTSGNPLNKDVDALNYSWTCVVDKETYVLSNGTYYLRSLDYSPGATSSDIWEYVLAGDTLDVTCTISAKISSNNRIAWSVTLTGYRLTVKKNLEDVTVTATNAPVFTPDESGTGQTQTLEFTVTDNGTPLTEGVDYNILERSNQRTDAGEYLLALEGKGNYTGTLTYKWTISPRELRGVYLLDKQYDGTTDLKDDTVFYYLNPDVNYVLLSKKGGKDFTATGGFDDPNAGERDVDVTITLNNENYTFENGAKTKQFTFEEVSIKPADSPEDPQPVTITVYNNREAVYTYDVSQLLPKLDGGRSYGATTYSAWWNLDNTYVPEEPGNKPTIDSSGVLRLPINAVDSDTENPKVAFFKITVQSTNYYDFYLCIYVKACNPLTPTTVAPTLSKDTLTYGDKLSNITLSGAMTGENNETVEGTFAWVNPDETPNAGEAVSVTWKFTPTAPKYAEVTGTATITVNPAQLTDVRVNQQNELTYNGTAQRASVETSATAVNDQKVTFAYCDTQDGIYGSMPQFTNAGEHMVFYKASAPNHEDATGSFKVIINKADPICTAPTGVSAVYGQTLSEITLANPADNTPGTWTWADGTQSVGDVGEHPFKAKFTPDDQINYNSSENISVSVTVGKAQPAASAAPAAKDLVYTGEAQALIEPGTTADGTMIYSLSKDSDYSETIPTGIGAGKYVVWYKIIGDDNHKDSDPAGVEVTIDKAQVTVTVKDKRTYVYGTAPDLSKPVLNQDYAVSGLIGSDTLTTAPTLTYDPVNPDLNKIGEAATIRASGASAGGNYEITYVDGKLIVVARPSSGGTAYPITVKDSKNGHAASSHNSADAGTTVTITVTPDKGYTLETLTVTDRNGKEVKLTDKGNDKYTFTMPASSVEVEAAFKAVNPDNPFVDVPENSYYEEAVNWAVENGVTSGTSATTFDPNGICTRAQAVTFLWRAAGSPAPKSATMPFIDVPAGSYYEQAVLWAMENGITKGTSDTTFSPDDNCSRAQIVTFLWRSQKSPAAGSANPFTDVSADAYYADAVLWAVKEDVTKGTAATTFSPDDNCTRAQIVTFLQRSYLSK